MLHPSSEPEQTDSQLTLPSSMNSKEVRALHLIEAIAELAPKAETLADFKRLGRLMSSIDSLIALNPHHFSVMEDMLKGEHLEFRLSRRINSFALSFDSTTFLAATGRREGALEVFSLDGPIKHDGTIPFPSTPVCLSFSPDNSLLAVGFNDGAVYLYRYAYSALTPEPLLRLPPTGAPNRALKFVDDSTIVSTVGNGAMMVLEPNYTTGTLKPRGRYGASSPILDADMSEDLTTIFLLDAGVNPHTSGVKILDASSTRRVGYKVLRFAAIERPTCLAMNPAHLQAAAGDSEGYLHLVTLGEGEVKVVKTGAPIRDVAFSPDGGLIAVAHEERQGGVELFAIEEGQLRRVAGFTDGEGYSALSFSPDGKFLLAGSRDGLIRVFFSQE